MNGTQLGTIAVIVSIFAGLAGVYYMARQSAREQERQRQAVIDKAVSDATAPLRDALAAERQESAELRQVNRDQAQRITQLEDELRRGRR